MRQSRREIHPLIRSPSAQPAAPKRREGGRARSRSPTWTCPHSPSLPTKRAGCRATRERKPLRQSRSGVWPWLLVTSQRGHAPARHRRPFSPLCPCPPTAQETPRKSERGVFTGCKKPRSVCRLRMLGGLVASTVPFNRFVRPAALLHLAPSMVVSSCPAQRGLLPRSGMHA